MDDRGSDIDRLLRSAAMDVEPPEDLCDRIRDRIDRSTRRRRVAGGSVLALGLAAGVWAAVYSHKPPHAGPSLAGEQPRETVGSPPREPEPLQVTAAATVRTTDPALFVEPVRSSRSNVSIVLIHRDRTIGPHETDQREPSEAPEPSTQMETQIWNEFGE